MSTLRPGARHLALAALVAIALCLGGCGGGSKDLSGESAKTLLAKAKAVAEKKSTLAVKGAFADDGATTALDLDYSAKDLSGTVTHGSESFTVLKVGGTTYFKASDSFWKAEGGTQGAAVIKALKGRWMLVPASDTTFTQLTGSVDRASLLKALTPTGTLTKGKKTSIGGVTAIPLASSAGTLYVAADDARPLRLHDKGSTEKVDFTYGSVTLPKAPADAEVVDASKLGG